MTHILGQPFQFILSYVTANIACLCTQGQLRFMVLSGIGGRQMCSTCKKMYYIESLNTDGSPNIVVELPSLPGIGS